VDPASIISQLIKHSRSAHKASKSRPFYWNISVTHCTLYRMFQVTCTKLQDIIIRVILSTKCYINKYPIINRHSATSSLLSPDNTLRLTPP